LRIQWIVSGSRYLSHSEYGFNHEITPNTNSDYITGYSDIDRYNTETGVLASTTGNISGIYDTSGGAGEYVMGIMADVNGAPLSGENSSYHSGFTGLHGLGGALTSGYAWPDNKYYDKYTYDTNYYTFQRRYLGDATSEMGPFNNSNFSSWYQDHSGFVFPNGPWFYRGAAYFFQEFMGIFAFLGIDGNTQDFISFRVVLTPTNI